MAISRVVSEIFNVEKCRYLEIGVRGHSRLLRVVQLVSAQGQKKARMMGLPEVQKSFMVGLVV